MQHFASGVAVNNPHVYSNKTLCVIYLGKSEPTKSTRTTTFPDTVQSKNQEK